MPLIKYRFSGIPARIAAAFTPTAALTPAASSNGILKVAGSPGTTKVRAPRPAAIPNVGPDPKTNPSDVAPEWIRPDQYLAEDIGAVMNPQDARFSWSPPFTVIPPSTEEVGRVSSIAFNPYPGLPHGYTMTWPRVTGNQYKSYTQPGVTA